MHQHQPHQPEMTAAQDLAMEQAAAARVARLAERRPRAGRKLPGQVLVRLTRAQADTLRREARAAGLTDAAWVRATIVPMLPVATEDADLVPTRPGRAVSALPAEDVLALARVRETAAELCGALVQAAIRTRESGRAAAHAEVASLLPKLRETVRALDAIKRRLMGAAR